jgi:hypothetical protein
MREASEVIGFTFFWIGLVALTGYVWGAFRTMAENDWRKK